MVEGMGWGVQLLVTLNNLKSLSLLMRKMGIICIWICTYWHTLFDT